MKYPKFHNFWLFFFHFGTSVQQGVLKTASLEKLKARFSVKLWIIKNR